MYFLSFVMDKPFWGLTRENDRKIAKKTLPGTFVTQS
jgi:hypothetical protein